MEKYSVLMSAYAKVIPEELIISIKSMLDQTVKPDQFILIWDGPVSEELQNVAKQFDEQNPGLFTIIQLPENHGLAYALNIGIEASRNELIARMDSDDFSDPTRCEKQLKAFEADPELALLGTCVHNFKGTVNNIIPLNKTRPLDNEGIKQKLRRFSPFAHPSVMYKKSAVQACGGYDPELRRRQDYDLFSKMVNSHGYKAANLEEKLLYFRAEDGFVSRNKNRESCQSRIDVQKRIYKRGECSLVDFVYIWCAMKASIYLPSGMYEKLYSRIKATKG
jgi:glycosyltransferase involved in cell wall biosynthesis